MEKDDDVKGGGNSLDFGARIYDTRSGRFLSRDPREVEYPWQSTYCFASNSPVLFTDGNGEGPQPTSIRTSWGVFFITTTLQEAQFVDIVGYTVDEFIALNSIKPRTSASARGLGLTVFFVLLPVNTFEPARCCTNELCFYNPCAKRLAELYETTPFRIYTDDPSTLPDWYLSDVANRVLKDKSTDLTDLSQFNEYSRRKDSKKLLSESFFLEEGLYKSISADESVDYENPVFKVVLGPGSKLIQWREPGDTSPTGAFYTLPGVKPSTLGIPSSYTVPWEITLKEPVEVLVSFAKDIKSWKKSDNGKILDGGGIQITSSKIAKPGNSTFRKYK